MILFPNLHGEGRLAAASGMNRTTVHRCLFDLEALGFVYRGGRYEAWILAPGVRQMFLGEGESFTIEGENLTIPGSSGSSHDLVVHEQSSMLEIRTTTAGGEGENITLPDDLESSWEVLVGMGCSPAAARAGLLEARGKGGASEEIKVRVEGWRTYCGSAKGSTIRAPGFLTARRVGQGLDAPQGVGETRDEESARYVEEMLDRIVRH